MTFGEKLYKMRTAKGWSQSYVASNLKLSRQSVSKWENDNCIPDFENIKKLSKLFEVSENYFLSDIYGFENTFENKSELVPESASEVIGTKAITETEFEKESKTESVSFDDKNTDAVSDDEKEKERIGIRRLRGIFFVMLGINIIGFLFCLCSFVPATVEYETVIRENDMIYIGGESEDFDFPEESVVTSSYRSTHNFPAFISTYYLHWVIVLSFLLMLYGVKEIIVAVNENKKRRSLKC